MLSMRALFTLMKTLQAFVYFGTLESKLSHGAFCEIFEARELDEFFRVCRLLLAYINALSTDPSLFRVDNLTIWK